MIDTASLSVRAPDDTLYGTIQGQGPDGMETLTNAEILIPEANPPYYQSTPYGTFTAYFRSLPESFTLQIEKPGYGLIDQTVHSSTLTQTGAHTSTGIQAIPVEKFEPGSSYRFSYWLWHLPYHSHWEGVGITMWYRNTQNDLGHMRLGKHRETQSLPADCTWNKYAGEFTYPDDVTSNTVRFTFIMAQDLDSAITYYADDFYLRKLP